MIGMLGGLSKNSDESCYIKFYLIKGVSMTVEEFEKFDVNHRVCECFDVTIEKLLEAIKLGHNTMDALMNQTDAGTGCELCQSIEIDEDEDRECHLEEVLEYVKAKGL